MENYPVTVSVDKEVHHFEVAEYPHHDGDRCKVKVYQDGKLVAGFEPDEYNFLHICQNPGGLDEELLHVLADRLDALHPHRISKDINEEL
ncbi:MULTISPECIES: hypothetical protein [Pedobacter]|uniref:hypothetical protein n=1 Tax=Pedobacter TaxID=84567 RepID=UPI00210CA508|nr:MULTISPECIES: hypothetical protein [unclassified Pedobacter]